MKIDISQIKVKYQNDKLQLTVLNNDNIDYSKTVMKTISNLEEFDQQVLNFLHDFVQQ